MENTEEKAKPEPRRKKAGKANAPEISESREAAGKKQFDIDIFRGWCKSCGICAAFCPRGCISMDEDGTPSVSDSGRCSGCGWCEVHCPDFAISVREKSADKAEGDQV